MPARIVFITLISYYWTENQVGFHESYESYINNLNLVWNECERVLHPGCRLCINIGDQFSRSYLFERSYFYTRKRRAWRYFANCPTLIIVY